MLGRDFTMGKSIYEIKKFFSSVDQNKSIFFFINNKHLAPTSETVGVLYEKYKSLDGILRIYYMEESTFGTSSEVRGAHVSEL